MEQEELDVPTGNEAGYVVVEELVDGFEISTRPVNKLGRSTIHQTSTEWREVTGKDGEGDGRTIPCSSTAPPLQYLNCCAR